MARGWGRGRVVSLYNGIRGCAADLGINFITLGIALCCRFREFGIELSALVLIWVRDRKI